MSTEAYVGWGSGKASAVRILIEEMLRMLQRSVANRSGPQVAVPSHLHVQHRSVYTRPALFPTQTLTNRTHWHSIVQHSHKCSSFNRPGTRATFTTHATSTEATSAADQTQGVADGVLLCGFPPEDLFVLAHNLDTLFPGLPSDRIGVITPSLALQPTLTLAKAIPLSLAQAAKQHEQWAEQCEQDSPQNSAAALPDSLMVRYGRVVYLIGGAAVQYGHSINNALIELDVAPAVVGGMQPRHASMNMSDVCDALRRAHAQYWELIRPASLTGDLEQLLSSFQQRQQNQQGQGSTATHHPQSYADEHKHHHLPEMMSDSDDSENNVSSSNALHVEHGFGGVKEGGRWGEEPRAKEGGPRTAGGSHDGHDVLDALVSTRVVVAATLDAGDVPCSTGGWRHDESHLVALDGLITDQERSDLLDWLTEPGHDHSGAPPDGKWEQACVDREGDPASWGLRQEVLQALEISPPPAVVALQTRLSALYPEYVICHMPAEVLSGNAEGVLSAFVGNAVMAGDPCAWHDDADPAALPPSSPWVHCYGYYYNREPGRPRFVSVLLYLNESWPDEMHAETLFLDNAAQAGLFVRPSAGRVVLMDQDMPHRISLPSSAANGAPRYSLVWKMVWIPRHEPTLTTTNTNTTDTTRRSAVQGKAVAGGMEGEPGLCRPEWGEPIRLGSAGQMLGKPAWTVKQG